MTAHVDDALPGIKLMDSLATRMTDFLVNYFNTTRICEPR